MAARHVADHDPRATLRVQCENGPLGAFLAALAEAGIPAIMIGSMAAIAQGAPLMTIDYDFWVKLPEREYVRLLSIAKRQNGVIRAATLYELTDGTQVNVIFKPDGLNSFDQEYRKCLTSTLQGVSVKVLPLQRVIASKKASGREKDFAALPALLKTLKMNRRAT